MKKTAPYYLFILVASLPFSNVAAQASDTTGTKTEIVQDPRVSILVGKHIQANREIRTMDGFRIQIFSDSGNNSKTKAQAARDGFQAQYPAISVYLTFKSPNYKVRIGDFRTKLDAQRFLNEITSDYPNAFIITDQIHLPKSEPL